RSVLQKLKNQTGFDLVFNPQMLDEARSIHLERKNATVTQALDQIFKDQPLTFTVDEKVIVVKRKDNPNASTAVQQTITGRVTDNNGSGIPGVTVLIKGTQQATSTDGEGRFAIRGASNVVLVFNMIGYKSVERPLNGATNVDVELVEDINMLRDVEVVSTGYQNLNRKLFTGSSTSLKAEDVKREGITDLSRTLEGRVAGVSVQNVSGTFGAAPNIRVRGATSISGDNKPLWVVDGIILEDVVNISNEQLSTGDASTLVGSSVAGLNPDDIESFNILKDAAATAQYGARAMNGVVIITTKKGRNTDGKPIVSYTGNFSGYMKPSYKNYDILNSADQMNVYLEMQNKGWLNHAETSRAQDGGVFTKMYKIGRA